MRKLAIASLLVLQVLTLDACATDRASRLSTGDRARCNAGDAVACHALASSIEQQRPQESDALLRRACRLGHQESCYDFAVHAAERGKLDESIQHYEIACKQGHLPACYNLGTCLVSGPCAIDEARGALRLRQACEGGVPHACVNLGNCYLFGRGVDRRPERARELFERACETGFQLACENLEVLRNCGAGASCAQ